MSSPLWTFSLAVYGADGVERECLNLQDRFGLDVNLILFCAFAGAVRGVALTADDIAAARGQVGAWHETIVKSLRVARRKLKTVALEGADNARAAAQLRAQVKAAELESEHIEQSTLEHWADAHFTGRPRGDARDAMAANLAGLLAAYGIGPAQMTVAQAMPSIVAAALKRAAQAGERIANK
jgi:uncharacterized protein (TIGR02444 family)